MAYNAWTGQYASSCFYKNGYFIQLAWNNGPENYRTVQTVTASDRDWQIAFSEGTDALAGNADFMEALKLCILEQKSREEKAGPSGFWSDKNKMEHPVVSYVEGPYSQTPDDLAQKTYSEEDSFALYVTVVDEVSPETAKALTERAYQEGDASRFSVTMGSMSEDSRFALAVKTYEEDDISMFSIICSELSEEHRKQLLDRAKKEQNSNYYYILKNDLEG